MNMTEILKSAVERGASDIFVVAGLPLTYKVRGEQQRETADGAFTPEKTEAFAAEIYRLAAREPHCLNGSATDDDFSFSLSGTGRFRVNLFRQRGSIAAVVRVIRFGLPTAEEDMEKSVALAQEAVALYTGDFLTESAAEFWCINLNTYYRSLYTRLCRAAVDRLLKLGRVTDAEKLCTGVIRLDPAAEEFSVFLMQALIKNKNPKKALEHYDYIASLYREVYGVSPSAELEAQKALAVQELYGSETSEDDIHTFLLEKEQEPGAFCCDNNVFREIVNLQVREMRRNDTPAALMIMRLANRSVDPEKRAVYMKQMEATLLNELRAGDPFTKVGANQFWVLLPGATGENGGLVSRRVFNRFQKEYPKSGAAYTFKSLDLRHIHMNAEEKATEKTERRKA